MFDHHAEFGIARTGAIAAVAQRRDDQAPVDLGPMVHPCGVLLPDVAALGEADAVQFARVAFQPERFAIAEFRHALRHAERQAMRQPSLRRRRRRRDPAMSQRGQPWIWNAGPVIDRPMDRQRLVSSDRDRSPQPVQAQPPDQSVRLRCLTIDQQVRILWPDDEVEQCLALRRQQRCPYRLGAGDIIGDQPLEEGADILS